MKEHKSGSPRDTCTPCSLEHYLQQSRYGSNLTVHGQMNKVWYTHTMEYNLAFKKRGNFAICDNMEECGGHYSM